VLKSFRRRQKAFSTPPSEEGRGGGRKERSNVDKSLNIFIKYSGREMYKAL